MLLAPRLVVFELHTIIEQLVVLKDTDDLVALKGFPKKFLLALGHGRYAYVFDPLVYLWLRLHIFVALFTFMRGLVGFVTSFHLLFVHTMAKTVLLLGIALWLGAGCQPSHPQQPTSRMLQPDFKDYWYSGLAEISSYDLDQSRYGEPRNGSAVLIFVTEDFSKTKHVKLDDPSQAGADKESVLKLNFTKNFVTGIYPYSLMLSSFMPLTSGGHAFKLSMTGQEWCGQVYTQVNQQPKGFRVLSRSYFEKEGDEEEVLPLVWLEDEVWSLLRIDPAKLPVGNVDMVPGLFFSRLLHEPLRPVAVSAKLETHGQESTYTITMPSFERSLAISFQSTFPYAITGWEEAFQERGQRVSTTARLKKTIRTDYWAKNSNAFLPLRDSLALPR